SARRITHAGADDRAREEIAAGRGLRSSAYVVGVAAVDRARARTRSTGRRAGDRAAELGRSLQLAGQPARSRTRLDRARVRRLGLADAADRRARRRAGLELARATAAAPRRPAAGAAGRTRVAAGPLRGARIAARGAPVMSGSPLVLIPE